MLSPNPMTPRCGCAGSVKLPMLTRSNYHDWSLVMQVSLEVLGLLSAVESDKVERHDNRLALAAILRGVPPEMKSGLAVKKTVREAWTAIKMERVGDIRVKEANAQKLLKEFETFVHVDGESVNDLMLRINGIIDKLQELGEMMEDKRVVRKILRVMPNKYDQIVIAIEMFSDLNTLKIEELVGKLRAVEDRVNDNEVAEAAVGTGRLLLTEEQWEAHRRWHTGKEEVRGGKGGGHSGGHSDDDNDASSMCSSASRRTSRYQGWCFDCREHGHLARNSPHKEKTMLADVDEEFTLL
jgi:hypothetical protein